ncbi:MAG: starch synthase [Saprospiraceae bacterium]|jgi:starch synthase
MDILHISAECYPVAKVGGLADVVGALPIYQNALGSRSQVLMPFYNIAFTQKNTFKKIYTSTIKFGDEFLNFKVLTLRENALDFDIFFIDIPELLYEAYVYSEDDTDRFLAFQIAALDWIVQLTKKPQIIHCHDYHTGLIPFMMSQSNDYKTLRRIPSVLTIHNAQYQGWFSHSKVNLIPEFDFSNVGLLDWNHTINPLAAAIKCAWRVTTVSPSYMEELKLNANGLEGLIQAESSKCVGILNGIDSEVWNPETDSYVIKTYSEKTVKSGKKANKAWLCEEFELDPNRPLVVFIGRLVGEKGADLFPQSFRLAMQHINVSILLLGSGMKSVENELTRMKVPFRGIFNTYIGYNETLAHRMYAGADFLLMPSRVEPCGLNQMYSLRYGTVPVVSKVGGLKDTVIDIDKGGFGISHNEITSEEIANAIQRAADFYKNSKKFETNRKKIMKIDHSWDVSAEQYLNLYKSLKE